MSVSNDCREFRELLNRTRYGELSREERAALERHAEGCADCAVELRIHAHVTAVSGAELESAVPDEMVDTMGRNVMEDLSRRSVRRSPSGSRMWPMMKILVPALAAAVVVLVFTGGFLFGGLRQLKTREQQLLSEMQRKDDLIGSQRFKPIVILFITAHKAYGVLGNPDHPAVSYQSGIPFGE